MLDMAVSLHTSFPSVSLTQGEKTEALRGSEEGTGGERGEGVGLMGVYRGNNRQGNKRGMGSKWPD